jgi:hydroxymethylbilane synthase
VTGPGITARTLHELPHGARIGTSSLRRRAQLRALRPDLDVCELRGNVGTRLRKIDDGDVDAALLAAAGLRRLGLGDRIVALLDPPTWLSAPGQGAIAVQARVDDARMMQLLATLDHADTRAAVTCERALLAALEGGCQVPIGAAMLRHDGGATLHGVIAALDGTRVVTGSMPVDLADPTAAGRALAAQLHRDGGAEILAALRTREQMAQSATTHSGSSNASVSATPSGAH